MQQVQLGELFVSDFELLELAAFRNEGQYLFVAHVLLELGVEHFDRVVLDIEVAGGAAL